MDSVKLTDKKQTKMIAHRGLSGIERENTINSFVAACNRSYFGLECDVHVTSDGKYLIYHDDNTGRICDRDLIIEQNEFSVLRALKLKESGSEAFSETLKIPTLEEYLAVLARYGKTAVIELKNPMEKKHISEIVEICKKNYDLNKIIFISFMYENLVVLRSILPEAKLQYLTEKFDGDLIGKLKKYDLGLDIGYWLLDAEKVKRLHENGIAVNCWTCDELKEAEKLISWGVDFITSNILE